MTKVFFFQKLESYIFSRLLSQFVIFVLNLSQFARSVCHFLFFLHTSRKMIFLFDIAGPCAIQITVHTFFLTILVLTSLYLGSSEIFLLEENWLQNVFTSICTQALVKYFCFEKKKNWAQNVFTLLCHAVKNNMKFSKSSLKHVFIPCQQIFTCSKSILETVEKGVKYVQS